MSSQFWGLDRAQPPDLAVCPPRPRRALISAMQREQKITLGEMRSSGPTRLLVYCGDYKCAHSVIISAERWGDQVRLSDLEPKFTCKACGHRGADVRPLFGPARMGTFG